MENEALKINLTKWIVGFIPVLIIILVVFMVSRYGFISTNVSSGVSGDISYKLVNQKSQKTKETTTSALTVKKLVSKASYNIFASQGKLSGFSAVTTRGFLGTTNTDIKLHPENNRQFVGNNPETCMYYLLDSLYSYPCNDSYSAVLRHMPASSTTPTYVIKNNVKGTNGTVEGTLYVGSDIFVLLKGLQVEGSTKPLHVLYRMGGNFSLNSGLALTELSNDKSYRLKQLSKGFLAYSDDFSDILYYSSTNAKSQHIEFDKPVGDFAATAAGEFDGGFFVAYSNGSTSESSNPDDAGSANKARSIVYIKKNGATSKLNFNANVVHAESCGTGKLCFVSGNQLFVYSVTSDKPSLEFTVSGVSTIASQGKAVLAITNEGVLRIDVDSASGYYSYGFGPYKFCGIQIANESYLLCLITDNANKVVLKIDSSGDTSGEIDKKIAELEKLSEVKTVSAYGSFIFISPNIPGGFVYNSVTKSSDYDPVKKKQTNDAINNKLAQLNIDRKKYTIINAAGN